MADPTFQIPRDVIEPIIVAHVQTAIVAALGGSAALVETAINEILTKKVDSDGKINSYDRNNTYTFIQLQLVKSVQAAVTDVLNEELKKHQDAIRTHITKELAKKNSPLIKQLVEGMTKAFTADSLHYRIEVSVAER